MVTHLLLSTELIFHRICLNKMQTRCHWWIFLCSQVPASSVPGVRRRTVFVRPASPCSGFPCGIHLRVLARRSRFSRSRCDCTPQRRFLQLDPRGETLTSFVDGLTAVGFSGSAPGEVLGFSWRPGVTGHLPVPPHHDKSCDPGPLTTIQVPNGSHQLLPQGL